MGPDASRRRTIGSALLVVGAVVLAHALAGSIPAPPVRAAELRGAAREHPALLAMSVVRLVLVGAGWYTLTTAALGALADAMRLSWLGRGVAALSPRYSRRLAGVLTTAVLLGGPVSTSAAWADTGAPTAADLPTMRWLPPIGDVTTPTSAPAVAPPIGALPTTTSDGTTRVVTRGDHFWRLAEATLTTRLGRPPTAREIAPYWLRLVDANGDRLLHRGNPNLIYAGQEMAIPPGD